jgi:putative transposase
MSRYRLLPTPAQEAVLRDHCGHARYVWNLAVEQHAVTARGGDGVTRPVNREPQLLLQSA